MSAADEVEREFGGAPLAARVQVGIFFLALCLRLVALAELHGTPWDEVRLGDARHFDAWGQRIAAGEWRPEEAFYQAPLYPYFLGATYALCEHTPLVVQVAQCVLGALAALLVASAAARLFGARAGALAGIAAALYAPAIWYDLQLEKTSLSVALTAVLLWLAVRGAERGRELRWPLAAGLALGALTLLRENAAVLLVPLALALGRAPGRARSLAALAGAFALVLLPVALHNHAAGGAPLPTATNAGVNFYIGNAAEADGQYRPLVAGRGHPDHERADARRIAEDLSGRALSDAGVSRFWLGLALREIAEEPAHFLGLLARKARLVAWHGEIMDAVAFEAFRDESRVLRALAPLSFGVLLPLALAGAVLAWNRRGTRVLALAAGLLAGSIVLFFVAGRFRLGLVPLLAPLAGAALAGWRAVPRRPAALALLALGALGAWWPLAQPGDPRATSASNLASELLRRGDAERAAEWAARARELDPRSAEAAFNLGTALRRLGRDAAAAEPFRAAMALEPAYAAECLAELGAIAAIAGDLDAARALLERALELDPANAAARRYADELARSAPGSR